MNIIVSSTLKQEDYKNFKVLRSLEDIESSYNGVSAIIIHEISDKLIQLGLLLSHSKDKGVKKFLYINSNCSSIIKTCIEGVNGLVLEDDVYLEEENLQYIIDSYEEMSQETETGLTVVDSVNVISDFLEGFSKGEKRINNKVYQERVSTALTEIQDMTTNAQMTINDMSKSTIQLFDDMSKVLRNMYEVKQELSDKIFELESKISSNSKRVVPVHDSIVYFPTINYTGRSKILYIKEKSECRYLISFLMGYQDYLINKRNMKVKIIVCFPKFKDNILRYSELAQIDNGSIAYRSALEKPVFAVTQPKKELISKLWSCGDDLYIIVDKMLGEELISGASINKLYAVSSLGHVKMFNLKENQCILPLVATDNSFCTIPIINEYPKDPQSRKVVYYSTCKESYFKLDKYLEV